MWRSIRVLASALVLTTAATACSGTHGDDEIYRDPNYASCQNLDVSGGDITVSWSTPCDDASCALDDRARDTVSLLQTAIDRQGLADTYRFLRAESVGANVNVTLLATIGWFQAVQTLTVLLGSDGTLEPSADAWVMTALCTNVPSVAPYSSFVRSLKDCNASIQHDICTNAFRRTNGCNPVGGGGGDAKAGVGECTFVTYASASAKTGTQIECQSNQEVCP